MCPLSLSLRRSPVITSAPLHPVSHALVAHLFPPSLKLTRAPQLRPLLLVPQSQPLLLARHSAPTPPPTQPLFSKDTLPTATRFPLASRACTRRPLETWALSTTSANQDTGQPRRFHGSHCKPNALLVTVGKSKPLSDSPRNNGTRPLNSSTIIFLACSSPACLRLQRLRFTTTCYSAPRVVLLAASAAFPPPQPPPPCPCTTHAAMDPHNPHYFYEPSQLPPLRTNSSTPSSSPGLFSPTRQNGTQTDSPFAFGPGSPYLHPLQTHKVREYVLKSCRLETMASPFSLCSPRDSPFKQAILTPSSLFVTEPTRLSSIST